MSWRTPATLCAARLSMITTCPGRNRGHNLFQVGQENVSVGGRLNRHGGLQSTPGQRCQHGHRVPMTVGRAFPHPLSALGSAIVPGHLRGGATLVQQH